jgi:hypothetical protein
LLFTCGHLKFPQFFPMHTFIWTFSLFWLYCLYFTQF